VGGDEIRPLGLDALLAGAILRVVWRVPLAAAALDHGVAVAARLRACRVADCASQFERARTQTVSTAYTWSELPTRERKRVLGLCDLRRVA
jgi:hypothetical protein